MDLVSIPKHVKAPSSMPNDVNLIKELMSYLEGKGFVGVQLQSFNTTFMNWMSENFLYDISHGIHPLIISRAPRIILTIKKHVIPYIHPHRGHVCQFEVSFYDLDSQDLPLGIKDQVSYSNHTKVLKFNTQSSKSANGSSISPLK